MIMMSSVKNNIFSVKILVIGDLVPQLISFAAVIWDVTQRSTQ